MNAILVCVSVSHGNTKKVADVIGEVLGARVVEPEEVDAAELAKYDLVGFGAGIYFQQFQPRLRKFVKSLPEEQRGKAFVYTTSGFTPRINSLVKPLEKKGFDVVGTFASRGWDTSFPFSLFGGAKKGRPNDVDLAEAYKFAEGLRTSVDRTA
ncbi:flavodoxin family protein [Antrihabitans cavernicola]|uniref:Flavodoxin n=1 Tax=Antrihabitans cavernicola TaxID=2495913 RepID=A0A5A7S7K2_9NOCA|nr:flavodoxin family protein [Spelaeibacter cavernicola]KAA0020148.1 flavodoxin [Spelaeibacter cavernicola]